MDTVTHIFPSLRANSLLKLQQNETWTFSHGSSWVFGGNFGPQGEYIEWGTFEASAPIENYYGHAVIDETLGDGVYLYVNSSSAETAAWFPTAPVVLKISATRWGHDLRIRTGTGKEFAVTPHQVQGNWSLDTLGQAWFGAYGIFDATATREIGMQWWLLDYTRFSNGHPEVLTPDNIETGDFTSAIDQTDSDQDGWADWYERFLGTNPFSRIPMVTEFGTRRIRIREPFPRSAPIRR